VEGKPPTSRDDSLVVVRTEVEGGGRKWKATNVSLRLVGGRLAGVEGGRGKDLCSYT
jgi:hypothetical protein